MRGVSAHTFYYMRKTGKVGCLPPGGNVGDSRPTPVKGWQQKVESFPWIPVRSTARRLPEVGDLPFLVSFHEC